MTGNRRQQVLVYVGAYTRSTSGGIYVYRMDASSGALTYASKATGLNNPSFLAIDPQERFQSELYGHYKTKFADRL